MRGGMSQFPVFKKVFRNFWITDQKGMCIIVNNKRKGQERLWDWIGIRLES